MMKTIKVMMFALLVMAMGCKSGEKVVLAGHEWQLSQLKAGEEVVALPAEAPVLLFTDTLTVYGSAGCNRFFGKYTTDGKDQFSVQPGGMTMMMCPDMDFESQFMKALAEVKSYSLTASELTLKDAAGKLTIVFVPKDTTPLIGVANDAHGCNAAAGYTWSEVQQNCVRLFEQGVRLNSATDTTATLSAFVVFSADSLKAEVFVPNQEVHPVLDRRGLPAGGYVWNVEDDDTFNVKMVNGKWVIEQRANVLYVQE